MVGTFADDLRIGDVCVGAQNQFPVIFHGAVALQSVGLEHFSKICGLHSEPLTAAPQISVEIGEHFQILTGFCLKDPCPHVRHDQFQTLEGAGDAVKIDGVHIFQHGTAVELIRRTGTVVAGVEEQRQIAFGGSFIDRHVDVVIVFVVGVDTLESLYPLFGIVVNFGGIGSFLEVQLGKGQKAVGISFADGDDLVIGQKIVSAVTQTS